MYKQVSFSLLVSMITVTRPALAQLDSSSAVLLRSKTRQTSPENLDTSKYKIRQPESRRDEDELEEKPGTVIPTPVPAKTAPKTAAIVTPEPKPAPAAPTSTSVPAPVTPPPATEQDEAPPPPVTLQVKELIMGGSEEDISEYKKQIHPQDPRANILDISLAPAYYYNDSSSEYSFVVTSQAARGLVWA